MLPSDEVARVAGMRMADLQRQADAWRLAADGSSPRPRRRRRRALPRLRVSLQWGAERAAYGPAIGPCDGP